MTTEKMVGPIPQIGFGTWNRDDEVAYRSVRCALDTGYRHIDTAEGYNNEEFVGAALDDSGIAREDIFVTTKVAPESFGPGQILPHVKTSLDKLRLEQVDLLLLHYPSIGDEYDIEDYMAQFAEVFDLGLARNIGVSNFTKRYIDAALALLGPRPILTNQVEYHPFIDQTPVLEAAHALGMSVTAYCPLAQGQVFDNAVLKEIGAAHGKSAAQVVIRWFVQQPGVIAIPRSSSPDHIRSNIDVHDFELTTQEMGRITALKANHHRLVNPGWAPEWDAVA